MSTLRVIGDVHAQIAPEDVARRNARSYLEIIADAAYSVQIGDMGDGQAYDVLKEHVDASRHRFFPGNHDHYDCLPPHALGDFGAATLGCVEFFFVRGASSADKAKLLDMGRRVGKTLWFAEEELTDDQMRAAETAYLAARPDIVLSHDAPTDVAREAWNARRFGRADPEASHQPSRTSEFLTRLLLQHAPRLWAFGHHHSDWRERIGDTLFVCVGELSHIDVTASAKIIEPH